MTKLGANGKLVRLSKMTLEATRDRVKVNGQCTIELYKQKEEKQIILKKSIGSNM